jgi:hypothetical protein
MIGLRIAQDGLGLRAEEIAAEHFDEGLRRHLLDVGPRREGLFRPGQDDAAHPLVRLGLRQRLAQFAQEFGVERVERVGRFRRMTATWSSSSTMIVL